jgi:hypothetical protein
MEFKEFCEKLETKIQKTYEQGVGLEEAERLAGEFLSAMIRISRELETQDLDSRMRKSGLKAVRGAAYLDIVSKGEKKPTESHISALIDTDKLVNDEQTGLDRAEASRDNLERYYNIFQNAHLHFRAIAKGRFE